MNDKNHKDYLDSLLFAAAKDIGKKDLDEYLSLTTSEKPSSELCEKVLAGSKNAEKKGIKKVGFKRFVAIAAAAALLVCTLTIVGIAGKKQRSASVSVSEHNDSLVLFYDMSGVRGDNNSDFVSDSLSKSYHLVGNVTDKNGNIGKEYTAKEGLSFTYFVKELSGEYTCVLGNESNTEYFDFLVVGKYNGCVAVTKTEDTISSAVLWNDGTMAHELYASCESDVLCDIAQSIYN